MRDAPSNKIQFVTQGKIRIEPQDRVKKTMLEKKRYKRLHSMYVE
jgi:hypothetical protein